MPDYWHSAKGTGRGDIPESTVLTCTVHDSIKSTATQQLTAQLTTELDFDAAATGFIIQPASKLDASTAGPLVARLPGWWQVLDAAPHTNDRAVSCEDSHNSGDKGRHCKKENQDHVSLVVGLDRGLVDGEGSRKNT